MTSDFFLLSLFKKLIELIRDFLIEFFVNYIFKNLLYFLLGLKIEQQIDYEGMILSKSKTPVEVITINKLGLEKNIKKFLWKITCHKYIHYGLLKKIGINTPFFQYESDLNAILTKIAGKIVEESIYRIDLSEDFDKSEGCNKAVEICVATLKTETIDTHVTLRVHVGKCSISSFLTRNKISIPIKII